MSKKIIISFTGTRKGMTHQQLRSFTEIINHFKEMTLVHGDCLGADADAHTVALEQGYDNIHKRPCTFDNQRAFTEGGEIIAEPEPPLDRNKKIVDDGDKLIACPGGYVEEQRSGTWSTVRYASKQNKPVLIIWPDGTMTNDKEFDGKDPIAAWLSIL